MPAVGAAEAGGVAGVVHRKAIKAGVVSFGIRIGRRKNMNKGGEQGHTQEKRQSPEFAAGAGLCLLMPSCGAPQLGGHAGIIRLYGVLLT